MISFLQDLLRRPGPDLAPVGPEHFPTAPQANNSLSGVDGRSETEAPVSKVSRPMPKIDPRRAKKIARVNSLRMALLFADRPLTITELAAKMKCSVVESSRIVSEATFVVKRREGRFVYVTHAYKI